MTGFLLRSSSTTPNSSSKDLICMLNDGWVTKQCSAAREKLPQLATASRYSSWMIVIVYLICTHENIKKTDTSQLLFDHRFSFSYICRLFIIRNFLTDGKNHTHRRSSDRQTPPGTLRRFAAPPRGVAEFGRIRENIHHDRRRPGADR